MPEKSKKPAINMVIYKGKTYEIDIEELVDFFNRLAKGLPKGSMQKMTYAPQVAWHNLANIMCLGGKDYHAGMEEARRLILELNDAIA